MSQTKMRTVIAWAAQIMAALIVLAAAAGKLLGSPGWITRFRTWGYPEGSYLVVGALELVGALALLVPRLAGAAAAGLLVIMLGAAATHLVHGEGIAVVRPLIVIVLLVPVLWLRGLAFGRPRNTAAESSARLSASARTAPVVAPPLAAISGREDEAEERRRLNRPEGRIP